MVSDAQSVPPEMLFKLQAGSLGPPPSGALSVAQVEASSKASSWRDRLRANGNQHLGEVEAVMRRRPHPAAAEHMYDLQGIALPSLGNLSLDMHMPSSSIWHADSGPMGLLPSANGQLWNGDSAFGASGPVLGAADVENSRMAWQLPPPESTLWHAEQSLLGASHAYSSEPYSAEPTAYLDTHQAMPMEPPYQAEQMNAQLHSTDCMNKGGIPTHVRHLDFEGMPIYSDIAHTGVDRQQIASQLRAAAANVCCYED